MTQHIGFGGDTLSTSDIPRIRRQLDVVYELMISGREYTLADLADAVTRVSGRKATEASVSARIRDLRKPQFGGYQISRRQIAEGLFGCRMEPRKPEDSRGLLPGL